MLGILKELDILI